jgi:hypothetical protein
MTDEKKAGTKRTRVRDLILLVVCIAVLYGLYDAARDHSINPHPVVSSSNHEDKNEHTPGITSLNHETLNRPTPSTSSTPTNVPHEDREYTPDPSSVYVERDVRGMILNMQHKTVLLSNDSIAITLLLSKLESNGRESYSGKTEEFDILRSSLRKAGAIHSNDVIKIKRMCMADNTHCISYGYELVKNAFTATTEEEFR